MSNKIIISLISEQSVPNMVLIKNNLDAQYFINIITDKMNDHYKDFVNAINTSNDNKLLEKFKEIKIKKHIENNIQEIINTIDILKDIYNSAEEIYINITGGTKILSIALYQYFYNNYESKSLLLYLNIDSESTSYNILNKQQKQLPPMEKSINLEEYLTSYGISIENNEETQPKYSEECADLLIEHAMKGNEAKKELSKFMQKINNKEINIKEELKNYNNIINYINYIHNCNDELPNIENIGNDTFKYINSGYFEEYLYYKIKSILLPYYKENITDYVKTGIKIKINNASRKQNPEIENDQELDILFMFNNSIYYIECKTYTTNDIIYKEAIFKQAAISNMLGLKQNNYFATLKQYRDRDFKQIKDKMKIYKIDIIANEDIKPNKIVNKLKTILKIRI